MMCFLLSQKLAHQRQPSPSHLLRGSMPQPARTKQFPDGCAGQARSSTDYPAIIHKEIAMPIVTIQVTREGSAPSRPAVTAEEKAKLIAGVRQLLLDVLTKPLDARTEERRAGKEWVSTCRSRWCP